jgi:hypothetical protein
MHAFECPCPPAEDWDTDPYGGGESVKSYVVFKAEPQPYTPGAFWWQRVGACRSRADAAQLAALLLLDAAILGVWVREAEAVPAEAPAPDAGAPDA